MYYLFWFTFYYQSHLNKVSKYWNKLDLIRKNSNKMVNMINLMNQGVGAKNEPMQIANPEAQTTPAT